MDSEKIIPAQLHSIVRDMHRCIEAKLYYPALLSALTLPEICAGLSKTKGEYVKKADYVDFLNAYAPMSDDGTTNIDLGVSADTCYMLRGGIVHRGNAAGHSHFDEDAVIFCVPETGVSIHGPSVITRNGTAVFLNLVQFCTAMEAAALFWWRVNGKNPEVLKNIAGLLSWHPNGLAPYVAGAPVVASYTTREK